ncbi:hypothetical protein DB346_10095 [Verrucomicrobia bacterium LW23]|nr:hypothetical protein DB346_10095 [Verrucomicrobia bacterium LW23]
MSYRVVAIRLIPLALCIWFLLAHQQVAVADQINLRWSQYNGLGPPGSAGPGAYNDWYPISADKVTFVLRIRNSQTLVPGRYDVYRRISETSVEFLWHFYVMGDRQLYADSMGNHSSGSLGYTHEEPILFRQGKSENSNEPIHIIVERYPDDIRDPQAPIRMEKHWTIDYKFLTDHLEFWTQFPMLSYYVKPTDNKAYFDIGGDDYFQPNEGGTPKPQGGSGPEPGGSAPPPQPIFDDCSGGGVGMAKYTLDIARAGFNIIDTPLTYAVPRGPSVAFTLNYRLFDNSQESSMPFTNLGKHWSNSFISYIKGGPPAASENAWHFLAGGGQEEFVGLDKTHPGPGSGGFFERGPYSRSQLEWVNDGANSHFVLRTVGGSTLLFASPDKPGDPECRYFLTEAADSFGNKLTYTYETLPSNGGFRLIGVADAAGQITTLAYENSSFPLQITKVTDPFGRFASITYDGQGRLVSVIDPIGIVSSFAYDEHHAYLNRLITPYGTTSFDVQSTPGHQILEVTNTKGIKERVEFLLKNPHVLSAEPVADVPVVAQTHNTSLDTNNAYYWTREAIMHAAAENIQPGTPAFYQKAIVSHLLMGAGGVTRVVGSFKKPLESRVWLTFPGQTQSNALLGQKVKAPATVSRKLPSGQDQVLSSLYNDLGLPIETSDPLGRTNIYTYAANNKDLLSVQRRNGAGLDILASFSNYVNHVATTLTYASGQSTVLTLNAYGHLLTSTNAKNEVTTYTYEANGRLLTVARPGGFGIMMTYNANGNVQTITDTDGSSTSYDYDALNRNIRTTYPDSTFKEITYKHLDIEWTKDRVGRSTHYIYDTERKLISVEDPSGHTIKFGYCACGVLLSLTDARGHVTRWEYDVQSRVIKKLYPDNSQKTYTYDSAGRALTTTDIMGQLTTYSYNIDNTIAGSSWSNLASGTAATPPISYTYDTIYRRLLTMTDQTGTTSYTYNPFNGQPGAGRVLSITGPVGSGTYTMTGQYDELGRFIAGSLDGTIFATTYDSAGRVATETNSIGTFTYNYVGNTSRISAIVYPNGITVAYDYENNVSDKRIKQIKYTNTSSVVLAQFDYTYNSVGMIRTWRQQLGSDTNSAYIWNPAYDSIDQIIAVDEVNATTKALRKRWDYGYDAAGNRLTDTVTDAVALTVSPSLATFNNLNQILTLLPDAGKIAIEGATDKEASVTVNGQPVQPDASKRFTSSIPVPISPGGNVSISITATDSSSQTTTKSYSIPITQSATPKSYAYDAKGNTISDGDRIYTWDALSQLIAINYITGPNAGGRTEFIYNGKQERVAIIEKDSLGSIISDKRYIWLGATHPVEERNSSGSVIARFSQRGENLTNASSPDNKLYYVRDHIGSIRMLVDENGIVRSAYAFDPFGNREKISGDLSTDHAYTGHLLHERSSLYLAKYRLFNSVSGSWLSRDRLGEFGADGPNLYSYVRNNPLNLVDPLGNQSETGSETHWSEGRKNSRDYLRLDSEMPTGPGDANGDIHIHYGPNEEKYHFNTETGQFETEDGKRLPNSVRKQLAKNKDFQKELTKAFDKINNRCGGFADLHGGGRWINGARALAGFAALMLLLEGDEKADKLAEMVREYINASRGEEVDELAKTFAAAEIAKMLQELAPGVGTAIFMDLIK